MAENVGVKSARTMTIFSVLTELEEMLERQGPTRDGPQLPMSHGMVELEPDPVLVANQPGISQWVSPPATRGRLHISTRGRGRASNAYGGAPYGARYPGEGGSSRSPAPAPAGVAVRTTV